MIANPDDVQIDIGKLQQKAALLGETVNNLKRAKIAEQSEIQQLLKQRDEIEGQIVVLEEKKLKARQELQQVSRNLTKEEKALKGKRKELTDDIQERSEAKDDLVQTIKDFEKRGKELRENNRLMESSLDMMEKRRTKLIDMVKKAKEILNI